MSREKGYPVEEWYAILHMTRSAYYKRASGKVSPRERRNRELAGVAEQIHTERPEMGCRRISDSLRHEHNIRVSDKRVLRICRVLRIKSTVKYSNNGLPREGSAMSG